MPAGELGFSMEDWCVVQGFRIMRIIQIDGIRILLILRNLFLGAFEGLDEGCGGLWI